MIRCLLQPRFCLFNRYVDGLGATTPTDLSTYPRGPGRWRSAVTAATFIRPLNPCAKRELLTIILLPKPKFTMRKLCFLLAGLAYLAVLPDIAFSQNQTIAGKVLDAGVTRCPAPAL